MEIKKTMDISSILSESKYWSVLQLPQTYAATNWPIRFSAIDATGTHLAVAGRSGLAHYSMLTKKWKLFGNESQEKDFVVSGGLLWWQNFIVMGCYSLLDRTDEIRCYPQEYKLDNQFGNKLQVRAPVLLLNIFRDQLIALKADAFVSLYVLSKLGAHALSMECVYEVDVKHICIHTACIVSLTVTNLRNDPAAKLTATGAAETIIVNVCGRILMIQRDSRNSVANTLMVSCLASCVECFWLSNALERSPMSDCLWLYSGAHGMRVWLPILPPSNEPRRDAPQRLHTFMSKRIMLSFPLKLYPLVILYDNVIVLGVENETTLYTNEASSHFSLPFCVLERKSQIYLHRILRQLIKRNLGYSAWEIAKSCRSLPYFPHALELLLHEVLEEEATSKEPIPDALLPSILDFIREFPVCLQTIVQCARKTEIALWPYLFSMAGKPKDLFQQCLQSEELETAASYLIILQNLEPSIISKQYATLLLDIALQNRKWDLAKDLIRFLKAIDPNEIDSPRSSMVVNLKIAPPSQTQTQVNQNPDVFNLILGSIARERSFSTTVTANLPKEKKEKLAAAAAAGVPENSAISVATNSAGPEAALITSTASLPGSVGVAASAAALNGPIVMRRKSERSNSTRERKEIFCIESILQRHARKLLQNYKLIELGYMSAYLDFHLVSWLLQEGERTAKLDDFVIALTSLHEELQLPPPFSESIGAEDSATLDYAQLQRHFLADNRGATQLPHVQQASSHTSESGYFSLALMDTPTSMQNGIPSIKEYEELRHFNKSRSNSQVSIDASNLRYRRLFSLHDDVSTLALSLDCEFGSPEMRPRILPDKLAIKIRYLLQLFIEAKCTDYALVLSILLLDAASIGRIINVLLRSESLATCSRIEQALKRLTLWSFDRECLYRSFMISLQPYIYLLEQYLASTVASDKSSAATSGIDGASSVGNTAGTTASNLDGNDNCDNLLGESLLSGEHHHHALNHITNGKVSWPLEGTRRSVTRQASLDSAPHAELATALPNGRRASVSDTERRGQPSACSLM